MSTASATSATTNDEITLKDAAKLAGKNERTLRRQLDTGRLKGRRKVLETGSSIWLVDIESFTQLFPNAAIIMNNEPPPGRRTPEPLCTAEASPSVAAAAQAALDRVTPAERDQPTEFHHFLLREHESLKVGLKDRENQHVEEIRERDRRIAGLQDENGSLREELGELRGRVESEAKMREWLQQIIEKHRLLPVAAIPAATSNDTNVAIPMEDLHVASSPFSSNAATPAARSTSPRSSIWITVTLGLLIAAIIGTTGWLYGAF